MDRGARVKFKPGSKAKDNWRISDEVAGLVIARYKTPRTNVPERVDVRFDAGIVVWGERATEFVVVGS